MITPLQGFGGSSQIAAEFTPKSLGTQSAPQADSGAFFDTLKSAMNQVQQGQADATSQVADLVSGRGGDIHGAMIAVEKADLSFQMMMQVRNKIVQAYQEISRMPF